MRKFYYLLTTMIAVLIGTFSANADNVSPYKLDFSKEISTAEHDFALSNGWGHVVGSASLGSTRYVSYLWRGPSFKEGVDGSACIRIGSQRLTYMQQSQTVHDYLVTPPVSGTVSIKARDYLNGSLEVYEATENSDGTFTIGNRLTLQNSYITSDSLTNLSSDDFDSITIGTFSTSKRLAIRGSGIYIDDFEAGSAQITLRPVPKIIEVDGYEEVSDSVKHTFGYITKDLSTKYEIYNDGDKALNITSITVPDGFKVDKTKFNIGPSENDTLTVTALYSGLVKKSGTLIINADEVSPFHIELSSTGRDSTKYFVDAEDNNYPAGALEISPDGEKHWKTARAAGHGNKYSIENDNANYNSLFITPLLKVQAGDKLNFDVARRNMKTFVNVYYSDDRIHWTQVDSISADDLPTTRSFVGIRSYYDFRTFEISNIPAGNHYIAFGSGYGELDNIYGYTLVPVAHDLVFSSAKIPENGVVNSELTTKATLNNVSAKEEPASYKVVLHFGNDVFESEPAVIPAGEEVEFNTEFTPHHVGTYPAWYEVTLADGYKVVSDTTEVTVAPEVAAGNVKIGGEATNTGNYVPLRTYDKNSESQTIYDANLLTDLPAGSKLTSITYNGYRTQTKEVNGTLSIWLANTDETPDNLLTHKDTAETSQMTLVYTGNYDIPSGGSTTEHIPIIDVNFLQPFTYTGKNLKIVVRSENQNTYTQTYFEGGNDSNHSVYRSNDNNSKFLSNKPTSSSSAYTPIAYLGVEKSPHALTGTVKNSAGAPVAGAVIKLTSGNVEYSDTADAQGNYSVTILKDELKYKLFTSHEGYDPYVDNDFKLNNDSVLNIVLKQATGLAIIDHEIPATGEVNTQTTEAVTLYNAISSDIAAADYDATLYVDGKAVANANGKQAIAPQASAKVTFNYTPTTAGKHIAVIKATYKGNEYSTSTDTIDVAEEKFEHDFTAGDSTGIKQSGNPMTPWNNYYKYSQSIVFYTPSLLKIDKGTSITRLRFRGSFTNGNHGKEAASIYIANTNQQAPDESVASSDYQATMDSLLADTASMTRVLDITKDTIEYGSSEDGIHDLIDVTIPGGFKYEGGNIIIVFNGNHTGQSDNRASYVVDNDQERLAFGRQSDSNDLSDRLWDTQNSLPVLYFTAVTTDSIKGSVVDKKTLKPIEGANIVVKSDDVEYYATSDAKGAYSIRVGKASKTYDVIFSHEGYITDTISNINFNEANIVVVNDTLALAPASVKLTGIVKGVQTVAGVADETKAKPLAGATVKVADDKGAVLKTATTDTTGAYAIDSLTEGNTYTVTFSAEGYNDSIASVTAPDTDFAINAVLTSTKTIVSVSGTVKGLDYKNGELNEANATALAGATVTLKDQSGTVIATATTATDGTYSIDSLAEDNVYTLTFAASGYVDSTTTVTAGKVNITANAVLLSKAALGINAIDAANDGTTKGAVYTINGQFIGRDINVSDLQRGVYIINGKKVTVK